LKNIETSLSFVIAASRHQAFASGNQPANSAADESNAVELDSLLIFSHLTAGELVSPEHLLLAHAALQRITTGRHVANDVPQLRNERSPQIME